MTMAIEPFHVLHCIVQLHFISVYVAPRHLCFSQQVSISVIFPVVAVTGKTNNIGKPIVKDSKNLADFRRSRATFAQRQPFKQTINIINSSIGIVEISSDLFEG